MTTTTMRELRANLKSYFDALDENKDVLIVPRSGKKEAVVIMTLSEYNSMVETDYLLSTEANRKLLNQSLSELGNNEVVELKIKDL